MLIWTAIVAFLFGLGKYAISRPNWAPSNYMADFSVEVGTYNAAYALLAFAAVITRGIRRRSLIGILILVEILGWVEGYFITKQDYYGTYPWDINAGFLLTANVQITMIFLTLLPLRCNGLLGGNRNEQTCVTTPLAVAHHGESA
jgi:hypothetical protein